MEADSATASAGKYREERTAQKRRPDYAQRDALDKSQWSAMEATSKALWPLAKRLCPFAKWRDDGVWENIFSELSQDADTENLSIDSTCVKVHESSNGGEKTGK